VPSLPEQVSQKLVFRVVRVEDGVGQEVAHAAVHCGRTDKRGMQQGEG